MRDIFQVIPLVVFFGESCYNHSCFALPCMIKSEFDLISLFAETIPKIVSKLVVTSDIKIFLSTVNDD